jgi:formate dehydrogenase subunit beta
MPVSSAIGKGVKIDQSKLTEVLRSLLAAKPQAAADALIVQQRTGKTISYTLASSPEKITEPLPFAPLYSTNTATYLRRWLVKGKRIAAVLRPCEQRAVIELMKLEQISRDSVLMIATDCVGAFRNDTYNEHADKIGSDFEPVRLADIIAQLKNQGIALRPACHICDRKTAEGGDMLVVHYGLDGVYLLAASAAGEAALASTGVALQNLDIAALREAARGKLLESAKPARAEREAAAKKLQDVPALLDLFKNCIVCKNCRTMCPVCYCQECFFDKELGCPRGIDLLNVSAVKGAVKLPLYALFFHFVRMYHVSQTCVACGACADACPKNIPLTVVYPFVARKVQEVFGYEPGRDLAEALPWKIFKQEELEPK